MKNKRPHFVTIGLLITLLLFAIQGPDLSKKKKSIAKHGSTQVFSNSTDPEANIHYRRALKTKPNERILLPAIDHETLIRKAEKIEERGTFRFATSRNVDVRPETHGTWEEGDRVCVRSESGEIEVTLALDKGLVRGAAALPHGGGNGKTPALRFASEEPGANANVLLPSGPGSFEPISCQAFMTGIPIEVSSA